MATKKKKVSAAPALPAKNRLGKAEPRIAPPRVSARPVRPDGKREFPLLADLPVLPLWKTDPNTGDVLTRPVVKQDENGKQYTVQERIAFDETGALQHRNRFGKVLMYEFMLHKRDKAPKRIPITVNDKRYTVLRGVKVILPWFAVHHMRSNVETLFHQEDDPNQQGRKLMVMEEQLSEIFTAKPIDACDDFNDEKAHLPSGSVPDLDRQLDDVYGMNEIGPSESAHEPPGAVQHEEALQAVV